jgi:hypothetical protein
MQIGPEQLDEIIEDLLGTRGDLDYALEEYAFIPQGCATPEAIRMVEDQIFQCEGCFVWWDQVDQTESGLCIACDGYSVDGPEDK